jgi:predicted nucleic acid-binding protein
MILADTSVWIEHFRKDGPSLRKLLVQGLALMHPAVRGELACGCLEMRPRTLRYLALLPRAKTVTDAEVMQFIEDHTLWGLGIGWVDAHLMASSLLSHCALWTLDRRLKHAAGLAKVKLY